MYGKKHSEETKNKLSKINKGNKHPMYGMERSFETKNKIKESRIKKYGIYNQNNIPTYDTYAHQIDWCEKVRRNKEDENILEVKCAYCGKWFIPKRDDIRSRIQILKGNKNYYGEHRLYCSDECKISCPIFNKQKYPKGFELATSREVQPELRQLVFERDGYKCTKCDSDKSLHCHHVEGILWEPLESADIDKCITLCKKCHKEVHRIEGCGYNDMKCMEKYEI